MSTNLEHASTPTVQPGPIRSRLPVVFALLAIGILYGLLSPERTLGLGWLLLPTLLALMVLIGVSRSRGHIRLTELLPRLAATIITLSLIISVILLIASLPSRRTGAVTLLGDAILLWVANVLVFAVWYWLIDGGGPGQRRHPHETSDFLFPQNAASIKDWSPAFVDYLFLAFNTSTAFSPTDTAVLTRRAKLLMMLQSSLSLIMLAVLAARAINIF